MQPDRVLLFVYNLDKSSLSGVHDAVHAHGPAKTPACSLCSLISSPVGMKKTWKRFIADLKMPAQYLYRDEFGREYGLPKFSVPGIFLQFGGSLISLISTEELNQIGSTDELIELVKQRLQKYRD